MPKWPLQMTHSWEVLRPLMDNFGILNYGPQAKNPPGLRSYIFYWYISYWAINGSLCDHIIKPPTVGRRQLN